MLIYCVFITIKVKIISQWRKLAEPDESNNDLNASAAGRAEPRAAAWGGARAGASSPAGRVWVQLRGNKCHRTHGEVTVQTKEPQSQNVSAETGKPFRKGGDGCVELACLIRVLPEGDGAWGLDGSGEAARASRVRRTGRGAGNPPEVFVMSAPESETVQGKTALWMTLAAFLWGRFSELFWIMPTSKWKFFLRLKKKS